ncbi:hypothetical protein [Streptomyces canus]|uniref:hypothetical protein n=1 Tax=Streptomyces canus TaxID=58343 RepID=UPI0033ACF928
MTNEWNRRGFVGTTAAVAEAAAAARLLSARGSGERQRTGTDTASGRQKALPVHAARTSVRPDMASVPNSPAAATDPGFLHHSPDHPATVSGVPGKRGRYTAGTRPWGSVPPPGDSFSCATRPSSCGGPETAGRAGVCSVTLPMRRLTAAPRGGQPDDEQALLTPMLTVRQNTDSPKSPVPKDQP